MGDMGDLDYELFGKAQGQHGILTRSQVLAVGGSDALIRSRLRAGHWHELHPGTYLLGAAPPYWLQSVMAACLAAAPHAFASRRAAAGMWALDGFAKGPIEITVPFGRLSIPDGVLVHRSRRIDPDDVVVKNGVPVSSVERTILEVGAVVPEGIVERAVEDAIRRCLTTEVRLRRHLDRPHSKGRSGAGKLRRVLDVRLPGRAAGSAAEVRIVRLLRAAAPAATGTPARDPPRRRIGGRGRPRLAGPACRYRGGRL